MVDPDKRITWKKFKLAVKDYVDSVEGRLVIQKRATFLMMIGLCIGIAEFLFQGLFGLPLVLLGSLILVGFQFKDVLDREKVIGEYK